MKSLRMAFLALLFTGFLGTHAHAYEHAVNGLYIGTTGGNVMGYMVSRERGGDRDWYGRDSHRQRYRSPQICRETVEVIRGRHGHYREVIRTVCRDRDDRHRPHHRDRYRDDRYRDYGRW